MRNLKKILCLALVLSMVLAVISGAAYTNYTDDAELTMVNEDYLLAAQLLQDIGVVVGVKNPEDGKTYYYPDQLLTRAELARVLYVLYSGTTDSSVYDPDLFRDELSTTFTDISGHWAEGYIKYGQTMGYLNGKSAEIFDPDANVKAQEMATALLIVLGYKAADLSPNYPVNVVKYGYTNNAGNLFTTGLSTAAASGGDHGMHIVGLGAAVGANEKDVEGEYQLERELTREEAFYMMYKAITKRSMVSKNLNIAGLVGNVDGTYYFNTGVKYVNYKFNVGYAEYDSIKAVVAGSTDVAFNGKYAKAGTVYLETAVEDATAVSVKLYEAKDFGYTAKQGTAQGSDQGYGYILSATDWNKQIGREITANVDVWNGKAHLSQYAFNYDANETTALRGFKGSDSVVVKSTTNIEADNGKIKITNGDKVKSYAPYFADGFRYIVNGSVGVVKNAADLAALLESNTATADAITLKVITVNKVDYIYGVIEEENFYATVSISDDEAKDGLATLEFIDGGTLTITNKYELAKGDRIFGYFNLKDLDAATKDLADKKIKVLNDGLTLEFTKVAPTAAVNVAVDKVNNKYYFENVNGTEFKLGAASDIGDENVSDGVYAADDIAEMFIQNETAYWTLYIVDGYCLEAVKTEKVQAIDLYVTAKSVVYNTTDNKTTYTFGLNTKADGKGDAYTFTKTVDGTNAAYEGIAKGELVKYTYDAVTKAGIDVIEVNVIKVAKTTLLAAPEFGNVDTDVVTAAAVKAAIETVEQYVENRIELEAAIVYGKASNENVISNNIAAKKADGYVVVISDYTYAVKA